MNRWHVVVLVVAVGLTGCSKKMALPPPAALAGERSTNGAMLAYEHSMDINLDHGAIAGRMQAVRNACVQASFGPCNVLDLSENEAGSSLTVRIVPEGVAKLSSLASEGGKVASHHMRAEDIGKAVRDNQRERAELETYAKRLDDLSARKDLAVADLIALSREQAAVAEKRRGLEDTAATQQNRLDTNRVTFSFHDRDYQANGALGDLGENIKDQAREGLGEALPMLAYGLPFLVIAFPLALLWWGLWRWATRRWRR